MIRNFLIVFLSIFFVSGTPVAESANCDSIAVSVDIRESKNGVSKVTFKVRNAVKPIHYVLYKENGELLSDNFSSNTFSIGEKGTFHYAIVDANGCKSQSEFKVE